MFSSLLFFFSIIIGIGWSFPFIIAPLLGLQFYIVSDQKVIKLLKKLKKYSSLTKNDEAEGWIIGWPFIGYIYSNECMYGQQKKELYIFTTKKFFNIKIKEIDIKLDETDLIKEVKKPTNIKLYEREGSYAYFHYSKRNFDITYFEPREEQIQIINKILDFYEKNRSIVVILHGNIGTGKSFIPLLLAKALSNRELQEDKDLINFCDTFKPTEPGSNFTQLYNTVNPSKEMPLVVVFEEFDTIIQQIHFDKVVLHKNSTTLIYDKGSWNQFFDRFDRKYFPWTLLIMTSNTGPEIINSLDPAYIREGRVNQIHHVTTSMVSNI